MIKRDVILSKAKSRIKNTTQKYGTKIPTSVTHALAIYDKNCNNFWKDSLFKEMTKFGIYFELMEGRQGVPPVWKKVTGHLVWDIKIDFTWKAIWVLDGHKTPNTVGSTNV